MNGPLPPQPLLHCLDALRERAMDADTLPALVFSIANDSYALLRFRQALVYADRGRHLVLQCISGLAKPAEDTPYLVWLARASPWVASQLKDAGPAWLARSAVQPPEDIAAGWAEWWPSGVWCVPLHARDGRRLGLLLVLLDEAPDAATAQAVRAIVPTWAYCWNAIVRKRRSLPWRAGRAPYRLGAMALPLLLLIPVRQTVLAPAEIVSSDAQIVSSPIDGVIDAITVRPNQHVKAGTLLFRLNETTLKNRAAVLGKQVAVADAERLAASQRAFDNPQSKSDLTVLAGAADQRRAELSAVIAQLQRTQVVASEDGVAVFSDPNDWLGKPVVTGERIMLLADPARPAIRINLAVADAIALEPGAEVTLYLTAYPLAPLHGRVTETSYQARSSEDGIVSYRLLASIDQGPGQPRLGLHGTAKLYGKQVSLAYYLLRRPLTALRAWTGL